MKPFSLTQYEASRETLPGGPGCDAGPEPVRVVFQGKNGEWHDSTTGRIISDGLGYRLESVHATACQCLICEVELAEYENARDKWEDEE